MRKDWEPIWDEKSGWRIDFYVGSHRIRRRLGIRDKDLKGLARKKAKFIYRQEVAASIDPELPAVKPSQPFYLAAKDYIDVGGETRFLAPLIQHFGAETTISDIDENEIEAAGRQLYPNATPDTRRRQVRVPINAILRNAAGKRRQKGTDQRRVRWLTPEEAERLLNAAAELFLPRHTEPELETLAKIAFLLGSGCRAGECFALDASDWRPGTRQAWIAGELTGAGKTQAAARWVKLPTRAMELMGQRPTEGRLFRTPYGKEIVLRQNGGGQMQTAFNKARDRAQLGRDVTPHVLRHTWATWFYAQTLDFGRLMDYGGWEKAETANRYRKLAPEDLPKRLIDHGWDFRQDMGNFHQERELHIVSKG